MCGFRRKIIYHLFAKFSQTDKNQNFLVVAKFDTVSFIIEMVCEVKTEFLKLLVEL